MIRIARRETPSVAADSGPHRIHHSTAGLAPPPGHISNPSGQPSVPEKLTIETLVNFSKCFAPGPPTRPAHLQESVIYTRAQAKVLAYGNNEGKVVVKRVLHEADGTPVSDDDFRSLMDYGRHVAYLLYHQKSPKAPKDAIHGVKYVKTYNRTLWNGRIALLEFVCPQLAYCQGSMMAQAVLGVSLDWWRQHDKKLIRQRSSKPTSHSLPQRQSPSQTRRTASPQFRHASPQFRHTSPPHAHQASRQQFKDKGKARDPGPSHAPPFVMLVRSVIDIVSDNIESILLDYPHLQLQPLRKRRLQKIFWKQSTWSPMTMILTMTLRTQQHGQA